MICKFGTLPDITSFLSSFILTMWYVNNKCGHNNKEIEVGFILTMWYVNEHEKDKLVKHAKSFILTMWYVNLGVSPLPPLPPLGFILTMWYVNERDKLRKKYKKGGFYINYVICKYLP